MCFGTPETGAEPLSRVRGAVKAMSTPSRARVSLRFMGPQDRLWGAIQPLNPGFSYALHGVKMSYVIRSVADWGSPVGEAASP
jgi:hypothetical protein